MAAKVRKRMAKAGLKKAAKSETEIVADKLRRELRAEKQVRVMSRQLERAVLKRDAALQHLKEVIRIFRGEAEPQAAGH